METFHAETVKRQEYLEGQGHEGKAIWEHEYDDRAKYVSDFHTFVNADRAREYDDRINLNQTSDIDLHSHRFGIPAHRDTGSLSFWAKTDRLSQRHIEKCLKMKTQTSGWLAGVVTDA